MFILNQAGDEIINTEQMISCRISESIEKGKKLYCINAEMMQSKMYKTLAAYPTQDQAKMVLFMTIGESRPYHEIRVMPNAEDK